MRLTENEQRVIAAVELNADMPMAQLEKRCQLKAHTIRYALEKLIQRGVLRYYPFINVYPLGLTPYLLYFSITSDTAHSTSKVIEYLRQQPSVSWLSQFTGAYQFCASVLCASATELKTFMEALSVNCGPVFGVKSIAIQNSLTLFPAKYIPGERASQAFVSWESGKPPIEIDDVDRKILTALLCRNYTSHREVGRQLKMPASTFDDRLKALVKAGVIVRFIYLVNPLQFGSHNFKLLLHARSPAPRLRNDLFSFCQKHPSITTLLECMGAWDFEIGIELMDAKDIVAVTEEIKVKFGNMLNTLEVLPQFEELKVACYPFTDNTTHR